MKKSSIVISSAAALVAIIAVSGLAFSSFAANSDTAGSAINKPFFARGISDETREQFQADREAFRAEREARHEAVEAVLDAGDYNAWVEVVGEDAPILEKINANNFSRFMEAHKYMEQGRSIMEELGIEKGGFRMHGMGGFHGHGRMWNK